MERYARSQLNVRVTDAERDRINEMAGKVRAIMGLPRATIADAIMMGLDLLDQWLEVWSQRGAEAMANGELVLRPPTINSQEDET